MIERVTAVINRSAHCDWRPETCGAGVCQCRALARSIFEEMRDLPSEPGPRYTDGEYSRRSHEAMIDDALQRT